MILNIMNMDMTFFVESLLLGVGCLVLLVLGLYLFVFVVWLLFVELGELYSGSVFGLDKLSQPVVSSLHLC